MKDLFTCVMDVGEQMLICGAEIYRVEDSVKRMLDALGAKRTDVFIITSSMVTTVYTDDNESFTQTRRIRSIGTDYEKLHRLNALSRKICEQKLPAAEIKEELKSIAESKAYPLAAECFAYALIAGAFTVFFGGALSEGVFSLGIGLCVRFVLFFMEKKFANKISSKFLSSFVATVLAYSTYKFGWIANIDKVLIGNIMSLIPGVGLTNALRDLFTGDSIAGLLRSIEAVLVALAIAAGYFLVAMFWGAVL